MKSTMAFEISSAEFALEAALLEGGLPHNNDDLEIAIPCRCYGRGLTREDFSNLKWPAAMREAAEGRTSSRKKKELSPIHKQEPKLCARGRGQLMSKSAAEYDMMQSQRSSRSSEHGQLPDRVGSVVSGEENDLSRTRQANRAPTMPKGYTCHICHTPGHLIQNCPLRKDSSQQEQGPTKSDWRSHSPHMNESPRNTTPTRENSHFPQKRNSTPVGDVSNDQASFPNESPVNSMQFMNASQEETPPKISVQEPTSGFSNLDFFQPEWLEKQNIEKVSNQKPSFNINVNVSKGHSGIGMNNFDSSTKHSQLSKAKAWTETEDLFSTYDLESGFHVSSRDNEHSGFFSRYGGFRRVQNERDFNLKEEEFPGLGVAPAAESKRGNSHMQSEEKKKSKGKKVKMVSYNSKENSPTKQRPKSSSQPASYSHAVSVNTPVDCQVMVQGLPLDCGEGDVLNLMEPYGQVSYINIQADPSGYSSAIVGLESVEMVDWVIECLSGAESLFQIWMMNPASVDPLSQKSLLIRLFIDQALVTFSDPQSLHWIVKHSPYLDFQLRSLLDESPKSCDVALALPPKLFDVTILFILTGDWMKSKDSVFWSFLDYELLLQAAAFLQIKSVDLQSHFPGTVDIHNVSRFSAAYWCYYSSPPQLSYQIFLPLLLYDINSTGVFNEPITRKNFLLKMRSNLRSNIRFNTTWNPKWLDEKKCECSLTHIHESSNHLTGVEVDDLVKILCVNEWQDQKREFLGEFLEKNLHKITCVRFPHQFGPPLLEHACQYHEAKVNLKLERLNEKLSLNEISS